MGNSATKPQGWHSRRHQTDAEQRQARENRDARRIGRPKQRWDEMSRTWVKTSARVVEGMTQ